MFRFSLYLFVLRVWYTVKRSPENNCAYEREVLQCWNCISERAKRLKLCGLCIWGLSDYMFQNWVFNTHFFRKWSCCKHYSTHRIIGSVVWFSLYVSLLPLVKCANSLSRLWFTHNFITLTQQPRNVVMSSWEWLYKHGATRTMHYHLLYLQIFLRSLLIVAFNFPNTHKSKRASW